MQWWDSVDDAKAADLAVQESDNKASATTEVPAGDPAAEKKLLDANEENIQDLEPLRATALASELAADSEATVSEELTMQIAETAVAAEVTGATVPAPETAEVNTHHPYHSLSLKATLPLLKSSAEDTSPLKI